MLIHFDKPECKKHKKTLEYLCMSPECQCQIRLCVTCTNQHCKKYSKNDFMKEINFYKKVQMETDIIDKQYSFLDKHLSKQSGSNLLSSKNEESIKMVEFVMRVVNEDKRKVYQVIDQFSINHLGVRKKLTKIQLASNRKYLTSIQKPSILSIMINLSSHDGLERLRQTILNCQNSTKKYNEFLIATQKYGDSLAPFLAALGFKHTLLKDYIRRQISLESDEIRIIGNESQKVEILQKKMSGDKNSNESNTCEQLFVPIPTTAKRIKVLTPLKRPKTSSSAEKEN